jgi:hypothetical protein
MQSQRRRIKVVKDEILTQESLAIILDRKPQEALRHRGSRSVGVDRLVCRNIENSTKLNVAMIKDVERR